VFDNLVDFLQIYDMTNCFIINEYMLGVLDCEFINEYMFAVFINEFFCWLIVHNAFVVLNPMCKKFDFYDFLCRKAWSEETQLYATGP
jgi:hypothetical protein